MTWLIGVDVGGTFTDFFAYDSTDQSPSACLRYHRHRAIPPPQSSTACGKCAKTSGSTRATSNDFVTARPSLPTL